MMENGTNRQVWRNIWGALGVAVGMVAIASIGALIILGSVSSVKNFTLSERLITKVDQLEERIMRIEVMVARGDNKCGG